MLCALRFFAAGSFQALVGSEETIGVTQPVVSKCVRRVAPAVVHARASNKWVHFPRTSHEKAAVKEGFLRRGAIPTVIGWMNGSRIAIIAPKVQQKAARYLRRRHADPRRRRMRPGSDHDTYVWRTTWLRRRFHEGHIAKAGDSGYPLEPWLLTPVPGHSPMHTA
ncbi:putative nuclease HARBI1 [Dermacentor albipictus]|uniref:putative nuclease HARBI1 n=1 Tax=Dermacentor albipictus TaxID=60249 RepID=UPI0038FC0F5F